MEIRLESAEHVQSLQDAGLESAQDSVSDEKLTREAEDENISDVMDSLLGNDQVTVWHKFINVLIGKHKAGDNTSIVFFKKQNHIYSEQYQLKNILPVDERKKSDSKKEGKNVALKSESSMSSSDKLVKTLVLNIPMSLDTTSSVSANTSVVMTLTEKNKTETKKVLNVNEFDKGVVNMSESIIPIKANAHSVKKELLAAGPAQSRGQLTAQNEVNSYAEGTRAEMTALPGLLKKVQAVIHQSENISSLKHGETRLTYNFKRWDTMGRQSVELTIQDSQSASQSIVATTSTKELRDKLDLARHLLNAPDLTLREDNDQRGGRRQVYRTFDSEDDA